MYDLLLQPGIKGTPLNDCFTSNKFDKLSLQFFLFTKKKINMLRSYFLTEVKKNFNKKRGSQRRSVRKQITAF